MNKDINVTEAIAEAELLLKFIKAENEKQKSSINELLTYISNIEEYYNGDFIKEFTDKLMYEIINSTTKISSGAGPEYYKGAAARQNEIIKIIYSLLPEKGSSNNE
jgi:hypothetical protein